MSTWEERMADRARARAAAEREREEAEEAEQFRRGAIARAFAARAALLAASPNPCPECYVWWAPSYWHPAGVWSHVEPAVVPGPAAAPPPGVSWDYEDTDPAHWCHHACHEGEPYFVVAVAMAMA